jgi:hypothetical protein
LLREEEIKWRQTARVIDIMEVDRNTKYFMAKANGRNIRNKIFRFIQEEGVIEGDNNLLNYATSFYKKNFLV